MRRESVRVSCSRRWWVREDSVVSVFVAVCWVEVVVEGRGMEEEPVVVAVGWLWVEEDGW